MPDAFHASARVAEQFEVHQHRTTSIPLVAQHVDETTHAEAFVHEMVKILGVMWASLLGYEASLTCKRDHC